MSNHQRRFGFKHSTQRGRSKRTASLLQKKKSFYKRQKKKKSPVVISSALVSVCVCRVCAYDATWWLLEAWRPSSSGVNSWTKRSVLRTQCCLSRRACLNQRSHSRAASGGRLVLRRVGVGRGGSGIRGGEKKTKHKFSHGPQRRPNLNKDSFILAEKKKLVMINSRQVNDVCECEDHVLLDTHSST